MPTLQGKKIEGIKKCNLDISTFLKIWMNVRPHLDPVISMQTVRIPGVHMFARASLVLLEVGKHVLVRDFAFISLSNLSTVPFVTTQGCINLDCHKKLQLASLWCFLPDVNECSTGSAVCDPKADCQNTFGCYLCSCKSGFYGNGKTCSGKKLVDIRKTASPEINHF